MRLHINTVNSVIICLSVLLCGISTAHADTTSTPTPQPWIEFPTEPFDLPSITGGQQIMAGGPWSVAPICRAYNFPDFSSGTGLAGGGVIGIIELGGGWVQSDLDLFSTANGLPRIVVQNVSVNGGQNSPGTGGADGEVALDIELAAASYYYATGKMPQIKVFFAPLQFTSFAAVIDAAVAADCDVLSISWGYREDFALKYAPSGSISQLETKAQAATLQGLTIFSATGDRSSSSQEPPNPHISLPSSCPHIVACGGTKKTSTTEVVWGDGQPNDQGTGGGYSTIFPVQTFQVGAPKAPNGLGRMTPDVAANAAPNTGFLIIYGGKFHLVGGTSAVSPLYAGLCAASGRKLGFITPAIWKHPKAFTDITMGSNGAYTAKVGPDPCTGLGVPIGTAVADLFSATGQTFTLSVLDASAGNYNATLSFNNPILGQFAATRIGAAPTNGSGKFTQVPPTGVTTVIAGTGSSQSPLFFGHFTAVIVDLKSTGIPIIFDNQPATIHGMGIGLNSSNKLQTYLFSGHD